LPFDRLYHCELLEKTSYKNRSLATKIFVSIYSGLTAMLFHVSFDGARRFRCLFCCKK